MEAGLVNCEAQESRGEKSAGTTAAKKQPNESHENPRPFLPCASASLRLCVKILLFKKQRQRFLTQSREGAETQGEEICFVLFASRLTAKNVTEFFSDRSAFSELSQHLCVPFIETSVEGQEAGTSLRNICNNHGTLTTT